ncbi:biogenesis of lysosome-related organelles complex 1 subunit 3-like [Limulus polyphemus]|uniref:Biogenesis of lysosome-related organelles complex 1 subunit 3 n=1 Tax=Limulus polyphemus TaxID=6850 RepID=A0ABM1T872_LIMPO|nr:biogenesis of lysosome-related organelles complex 1 subunit 3-like [Limulus polyphemus]
MSGAGDGVHVISGMDGESDEDFEVSTIMSKPEQSSKPVMSQQGIVVSGEAPESDEEERTSPVIEETSDLALSKHRRTRHLLKDDSDTSDISSTKSDDCLKYNTLLHKKLRERNISMQKHVEQLIYLPYESAGREINSITQQLLKSQDLVQELASSMRKVTNDLFQLEDRLDAVLQDTCLPDFRFTLVPAV